MGTLARPSERAIGTQWARPHLKPRSQRRRHVVQRQAAITAGLIAPVFRAQPVASRWTLRIQTLHRPARQILHVSPSDFEKQRGTNLVCRHGTIRSGTMKIRGDCERGELVCQQKSILLVVVGYPRVLVPPKICCRACTARFEDCSASGLRLRLEVVDFLLQLVQSLPFRL